MITGGFSPVPTEVGLPRNTGFTLVELLVVVTVIATLVALLIPGGQAMIRKSDSSGCLSNLRQIGVAMSLYAGEHDGSLPGPTYGGLWINYSLADTNNLTVYLAPYLGYPEAAATPAVCPVMVCPGYKRRTPANLRSAAQAASYTSLYDLYYVSRRKVSSVSPWGRPSAGPHNMTPLRQVRLAAYVNPSTTWAIMDANPKTATVRADTPGLDNPVHGKYSWNRLYFDGHAESTVYPNDVHPEDAQSLKPPGF